MGNMCWVVRMGWGAVRQESAVCGNSGGNSWRLLEEVGHSGVTVGRLLGLWALWWETKCGPGAVVYCELRLGTGVAGATQWVAAVLVCTLRPVLCMC